jgi:hypothetical protein
MSAVESTGTSSGVEEKRLLGDFFCLPLHLQKQKGDIKV